MNLDELGKFCAEDTETRRFAFEDALWTYTDRTGKIWTGATDGNVLVLLPEKTDSPLIPESMAKGIDEFRAAQGVGEWFRMPTPKIGPCETCGGMGTVIDHQLSDCQECDGTGTTQCPRCDSDIDCPQCGGTGRAKDGQEVEIPCACTKRAPGKGLEYSPLQMGAHWFLFYTLSKIAPWNPELQQTTARGGLLYRMRGEGFEGFVMAAETAPEVPRA